MQARSRGRTSEEDLGSRGSTAETPQTPRQIAEENCDRELYLAFPDLASAAAWRFNLWDPGRVAVANRPPLGLAVDLYGRSDRALITSYCTEPVQRSGLDIARARQ